MKRVLVLFVMLIIALSGVFAVSYVESSLGVGFFTSKETVHFNGQSVSGNEKTTLLSSDFTFMTFSGASKIGFDIGISILFPLSSSLSGVDVDVEFFNCNWCPRIGVAWKYEISPQLTMLSAAGYELIMNYSSAYQSGITIRSSLFVHCLYATDRVAYKVNDDIVINAGLMALVPVVGFQKLSATGYESERYTITYSGIMINPFIGIDIKQK